MTTTALPELGPDGRARASALAALRLADVAPTSIVEFMSRGRCLVVGDEAPALDLVRGLQGRLECTVVVPGDTTPDLDQVDGTLVVRGGRPLIRGALGDFAVTLASGGRNQALGAMLAPPVERFDLVVDLGSPPLLRQAMLPLGYYAPGADEDARAALLESLPEMRGEFEKPKYFNYNPEICAHGRSGKRGCTRCIDVCPAEAIVSIGETVQVNPYLCQGGGACATACPSGAMTYAYPTAGDLLSALRRLLRDYHEAGGTSPTLLFHDSASAATLEQGLAAGMPERILPVAIEEIGSVGMDVWLACLAYGAESVVLLTCDRTPAQIIEALAGAGHERAGHRRRDGLRGEPPAPRQWRPAGAGQPGSAGRRAGRPVTSSCDVCRPGRGQARHAAACAAAPAVERARTEARHRAAGRRAVRRDSGQRGGLHAVHELRLVLPDARAAGWTRPAPAELP